MQYEIVVDGFALDVEVTHCVNIPPCPGTWSSDWDAQGTRELEFRVVSVVEYDDAGNRVHSPPSTTEIETLYAAQIETALWFEIDSLARRYRRAA